MSQQLVFFDFDGTLTRHDSLLLFLYFAGKKKLLYLFPLLLGVFFMYKCGVYSAQEGKEKLLKLVCSGKNKEELDALGKQFILYLLAHKKRFFRENALESIEEYKKSGSRVYIVSASPETWIAFFAQHFGIMYIATKLDYEQGVFKGKFLGENCNGEEKKRRIQEDIPELSQYSSIIAYGDTKGDFPMFELATKTYFKPFRSE